MRSGCLAKNTRRVHSNRMASTKTSQVPVQRVVLSRSLNFNKFEAMAGTAGESKWAQSTQISRFTSRASPMAATKRRRRSRSLESSCGSPLPIILEVIALVVGITESPRSFSGCSKTINSEDLRFQTAKTAKALGVSQ